jgi:hypothetical protein
MADAIHIVDAGSSSIKNVADYLAKEALKDGSEVTIRAMHSDDKERLVKAGAKDSSV